ncbi:magnesium transporter NIPA-domain-containing protein [Mycena vitilis]|nr:magnesium transporter NIPA-domain-containing protein [Mycena vitilis]
MIEGKYIGFALAVAGSAAIGMSTVITKMGLIAAGDGASATENMSYLRNGIWWSGMAALVVGELANFAAYTFAPPIMVTPLGALSVIVGAILAAVMLKERLGHLGRVGCGLCILGSSIIVLHAPEDQELETVTQFLEFAVAPGFLLYCFTVCVFSLVMAYGVAPKHGRTNPLVYISIASLVGSVSVMFVKGFGVAVKLTFAGHNQFIYPSTYLFAFIFVACIVIQLNYANKALDIFSVNLVNPMYYVGFCTATIVASLILFKGFNTTDAATTISLLCGFAVTFLGVHVLNLALLDESAQAQVALEGGHSPWHPAHSRGSLNGLRTPLFGAFAIDAEDGGGVRLPLHQLLEEEDEEDEGGDGRVDVGGSRASPHGIRISRPL